MKKRIIKSFAFVLSDLICFTSIIPSFAYNLDSSGNSVENIEYQNTEDEDYTNQTNVFAELGSEYKVTIPKTIVLSGVTKSANYYVKVEGDIAGYETVNVVPDENVVLSTKNKDSRTGTITQDKTSWKVSDFDTDANGTVQADSLTAGKWQGTFNFNIYMDSHEEMVLGDLVLPPVGFDATSPAQASASQVVNAKVGEAGNINVTYENEDVASDSTITSSNEDVVKVDMNRLTAVNVGTSTITVDYDTSKSGNDEGIKSYSFDVKVSKDEEPITLAAGLYDENDNLIVSWDEMVSETGFDVSTDYTNNTYSQSAFYSVTVKYPTVKKVVIPEGIEKIGNYAFKECTSLTSVTIPDSITTIGNYAFTNCTSLKSINSNTEGEFIIPNSVTIIEKGAFCGCKSLKLITIPNSVTTIESYVFTNCTSLTSIEIPDSVTSIGYSAFNNCTSLTSIEIPDSVIIIGSYAFNNCTSLTSVTIPDSVKTIDKNAFSYCKSLKSITIPDSVTTIGENIFQGCTSLTSITIPDSVTSISNEAFLYCDSLTSISIPNSVTTFGISAFNLCTSLTSITYNGTKAQWNAIKKGSSYNYKVPTSCVVHCTDGDITLS